MKFEKQEQLKEHLPEKFFLCFKELEQKVRDNFFTAWSFANEDGCMSGFGLGESPSFHPQFDLASLTKPFFINLYLRFQWEKNSDFVEKVTTPLSLAYKTSSMSGRAGREIFSSFFRKKENEKFSLDSFLSHTSGAKSWFWMGSALYGKDSIVENLRKSCLGSLGAKFGETVYSDINYFILARILEDISTEDFDWNKVTDFLNMRLKTNFFHASLEPQKTKWSVPFYPYIILYSPDAIVYPSTNTQQGHQNIKMAVHDPNANFLAPLGDKKNIVSSHSGLFGNVIDVVRATCALSESQRVILKSCTKNRKMSDGFAFGLDRPSSPQAPSGVQHWQEHKNSVYGHLGYTGTSFWFFNDPKEREPLQFHILLTNRTAQRKEEWHNGSCASEGRLFIYTDFKNNSQSFFLKSENCFFSISQTEAQEKIKKYYESSMKKIDASVLRDVPNMSDLRKFIANHLWDI